MPLNPCLDNLEDAGHDGAVGEVAGELRLVGGDALDADRALPRHVLKDLVHEQERVAVGQDFADVCVDEDLRVLGRRRLGANGKDTKMQVFKIDNFENYSSL